MDKEDEQEQMMEYSEEAASQLEMTVEVAEMGSEEDLKNHSINSENLARLIIEDSGEAGSSAPSKIVATAAVAQETKRHYCTECKISFSSGKALGGHMSSAHIQGNKYSSMKKTKSKKKKHEKSEDFERRENTCWVCKRGFTSKKSLFGHMRSHPERGWRGVEPPSREPEINLPADYPVPPPEMMNSDKSDSGPDATNVGMKTWSVTAKTWSVTAKRGRRALKPVDSLEDEEVHYAGHQLLRLLNGNSGKRKCEETEGIKSNPGPDLGLKKHFPTQNKLKICEGRDADKNIHGRNCKTGVQSSGKIDCNGKGKRKAKLSESSRSMDHSSSSSEDNLYSNHIADYKTSTFMKDGEGVNGKGKAKQVSESENSNSKTLEDSLSSPSLTEDMDKDKDKEEYTNGSNFKVVANGKKQPQRAAPKGIVIKKNTAPMDSKSGQTGSSSTLSRFTCNICGKSFSNPQAFGGHRASHNKLKISIYNFIDQPKNAGFHEIQNPISATKEPKTVNPVVEADHHKASTDEIISTRDLLKVLEYNLNESPKNSY